MRLMKPIFLLIDMQVACLNPDGSLARRGLAGRIFPDRDVLVQNCANELRHAREEGYEVVFTRVYDPDFKGPLAQRDPSIKEFGAYDGADAEIIDELKPLPSELVLDKFAFGLSPDQLAIFSGRDVGFGGLLATVCAQIIAFQVFEAGAKSLRPIPGCLGDVSEERLKSALSVFRLFQRYNV